MHHSIDTETAIIVLKNLQDWLYFSAMNGGTSIQREAIDIAIGALKQSEIIRCKDCKHYQFADNRAFGFPVRGCCRIGFEDVDEDDFCSRAERRTR